MGSSALGIDLCSSREWRNYISGRRLRNVEARWSELFQAYEALGVS